MVDFLFLRNFDTSETGLIHIFSGGNCDIKNLSRGSKVFLPVHVKGAKFSVGDLHFSQGDGEISFCGAIEMSGVITINFKVMVSLHF